MRDFIRLIIILLLLPVIIILIGPLLVLAALRGQQWMGPITLNSARYGPMGRAGILLLGAAIWILVWSALAWLALETVTPTAMQVALPTPTPAVAQAQADAVTPSPTAAPPTLTATRVAPAAASPSATPLPATATHTPPATATVTATATLTPTPSPTATPSPLPSVSPTATPTGTPTARFPLLAPTITPRPLPTVSPADRRAALAAVNRANDRLRLTIIEASDENLENLSQVWQGKAFNQIQDFALDLNERYAQPRRVDYKYINPPAVSEASVPGQIVVTSVEEWTYGSPSQGNHEILEFIYTVVPVDDVWAISRYTYRNLPKPGGTATISTRTPTPTAAATTTAKN